MDEVPDNLGGGRFRINGSRALKVALKQQKGVLLEFGLVFSIVWHLLISTVRSGQSTKQLTGNLGTRDFSASRRRVSRARV